MHQIRATKFVKVTATLFMAAMAGPLMLSAAGLSGNLSLSSSGSESIAVDGSTIVFDFSGTVTPGFPPTTTDPLNASGAGTFDIASPASTDSFAPLGGTTATVKDLTASMQPIGTTIGPGLPLGSFITFTAEPGWNITLTEINAGTDDTACNGSSEYCTPAGSPFNIQNENSANQTMGSVSVAFAFEGTASDGMGDTSAVSGTFFTTFADTSYQTILADLNNNGESIVSSANATIGVTTITTAPEPASIYMLLLGSGLLMGSAAYRRRQRR